MVDAVLHHEPLHIIDDKRVELCVQAGVKHVDVEVDCICPRRIQNHRVVSKVRNLRSDLHRVDSDKAFVLSLEDIEVRGWLSVLEEVLQANDLVGDLILAIWCLGELIGVTHCVQRISNRVINILNGCNHINRRNKTRLNVDHEVVAANSVLGRCLCPVCEERLRSCRQVHWVGANSSLVIGLRHKEVFV